jgi:hypothetical protein
LIWAAPKNKKTEQGLVAVRGASRLTYAHPNVSHELGCELRIDSQINVPYLYVLYALLYVLYSIYAYYMPYCTYLIRIDWGLQNF